MSLGASGPRAGRLELRLAAERDVCRRRIFAVESRGAGMFDVKFRTGFEQPDAAVPAEDAVVITGGAGFFGFGKAAQGFFDKR